MLYEHVHNCGTCSKVIYLERQRASTFERVPYIHCDQNLNLRLFYEYILMVIKTG